MSRLFSSVAESIRRRLVRKFNTSRMTTVTSQLAMPITAATTEIKLQRTGGLLDSGYVTIDSEIIGYTSRGNQYLYGCTRGEFSTVAATHVANATVTQAKVGLLRAVLEGVGEEVNRISGNVATSLTASVADPITTRVRTPVTLTAGTIYVISTTGFPGTGTIGIGTELITYAGTTSNSFTGCTRGVGNSNAATHNRGDTVCKPVDISLDDGSFLPQYPWPYREIVIGQERLFYDVATPSGVSNCIRCYLDSDGSGHASGEKVWGMGRSYNAVDNLMSGRFVDTAALTDLERIGALGGTPRPTPGFLDDPYRLLVSAIGYQAKGNIHCFEKVLDVFFGAGGYRVVERLSNEALLVTVVANEVHPSSTMIAWYLHALADNLGTGQLDPMGRPYEGLPSATGLRVDSGGPTAIFNDPVATFSSDQLHQWLYIDTAPSVYADGATNAAGNFLSSAATFMTVRNGQVIHIKDGVYAGYYTQKSRIGAHEIELNVPLTAYGIATGMNWQQRLDQGAHRILSVIDGQNLLIEAPNALWGWHLPGVAANYYTTYLGAYLRATIELTVATYLLNSCTAVATTLDVGNTVLFPATGIVQIDSEWLYYDSKTLNTLVGCVRGLRGTTATTHSAGASVTLANSLAMYPPYLLQPYTSGVGDILLDLAKAAGVEVRLVVLPIGVDMDDWITAKGPDPLIYP